MAKKDTKTTKTKTAPAKAKKAASVKLNKVAKTKTTPAEQLYKWNIAFAAILLLQALAIMIFGGNQAFPVALQFPAVDQLASSANGHEVIASATRHLFDLPIMWVVVAILVLLAGSHAAVATAYRKRYEASLERGVSEARWATIGVVGGVVLLAVSLLSGIYQLSSLLMIFTLSVVGCLAVFAAENLTARNEKGRLSHLVCALGLKAVLLPWVVLALGVVGTLLYNGQVPAFVYGIYLSLGLFTVALMWLTHLRIKRAGKWTDSYKTEKAYMLIGLGAVSAVAWQIFAGALN